MARQHGQNRGAQCNPEDAERHLVQAVGKLQQRERPLRQTGGEEGVDQLADLVNSGSEGCRQHQHHQAFYVGRDLRHLDLQLHACAPGCPPHVDQLSHASERQRYRQRPGHGQVVCAISAQIPSGQDAADHYDVEQHRHHCTWSKLRAGVEHTRQHGHQAYQCEIGESHPAEHDRQFELARDILVLARKEPDDRWHGDHAQRRKAQQDPYKYREYIAGKPVGGFVAAIFLGMQPPRVHRHEGNAECAFCEQAAKRVRQGKG